MRDRYEVRKIDIGQGSYFIYDRETGTNAAQDELDLAMKFSSNRAAVMACEKLNTREELQGKPYLGFYYPARSDSWLACIRDGGNEDERPDGDTWSEPVWLRLANGDLILGRFPQGDTYFEHEVTVEQDWDKAKELGKIVELYDTSL